MRRVLALIAVVVLGAAVAVTLTLVDRSAPVRTSSRFVAGTAEPGVGPVALDTTLYLPAATPAPAILLAQGFGGSKTDLDGEARGLARHGYVVLAYTARGFGRSGGLIHLDAPAYEVADASKLISYLATLPQVVEDAPGDPRVGVAGSSYGGALALLVAGSDKRVDAVAADITWNDLAQSLFPNASGDGPGVFKKLWAGELFASGAGAGTAGTTGTGTGTGTGGGGGGLACGRFAPQLCAAYQQAASTGQADPAILALLRASSPAAVLSRITAPTLLTQGEQDSLFPLDQADANAKGIAASGTPVKVLWRAGGHDGGTSTSELTSDVLGWFDPVLKDRRTPSTGFDLALASSAISSATGLRIGQTLHAAGGYPGIDGHPVTSVPITVAGPAQTISAPAGGNPAAITALPGLGGLLGAASSAATGLVTVPGQVAGFVSSPLTTPLLIAGASTVTLDVAVHGATDATLFVALHDLGPGDSGNSDDLPADLVAPMRLTGLTPAGARQVRVTLPSVVTRVAAGHRIELTVATTDLAYSLPVNARTYAVSLAAGSAVVAVPTVDATVIRAGHPVGWLLAGLLVIVAVLGIGLLRGLRRRRALEVVAELADVPVSVEGLVKEYRDGYRAVDGVTFRVETGQVVGLLGPNGAGKTTTLRVLMGLIRPTEGVVRVFGEQVLPGSAVLSRIGAFVEGPGFLPHLSGRQNLELYWAATGRPAADADLATALEIAGLGASLERKVKTYSHGMSQRLAIAQAMLGLPELLVLDEPTNGLDPPQIAEMREVLRRYAASGRTVIVSSHLLAEVEQTCTHVVVMHKGRLIAAGSVAEIAGSGGVHLVVADPDRAARVLAEAGISAAQVPARRALEDVFLDLVGDDGR
ncbi:MAG TPA: alpha/beta fold hydrolase [Jatrophihabitantaceae bacterium]|jgi:ABC-2 type transport system ATP-binding protein|nr:alpha/beta fold hydrolase [Jatrophihabitantaceae bacterium]